METPKILIVDDDAKLRESLRDLLEMEGYQVQEASNGREVMEAVVTTFFDIILMDFNLTPDKTGLDVIRDIRKVNKESQILMITAHDSLDTAVMAIQESVYDFLIKPVDFNYLKMALAKCLEKLRLQQENQRLFGELKVSNEQLTNLNNMKSKFLSMASHDLANSLMTLQVSFELLCGTLHPTEEQKKNVQYIASSIGQISRLISDLVDWASIEQGKFRLEKNSFELSKLLEELLPGVRARAGQKDIQISEQISSGIPVVYADRRRFSQVLLNLLENAIRHTPRSGKIQVAVQALSPQEVHVSVQDTGEGIDPRELPKLFQSFYQPEGSRSPQGRLGLGLSIAREIVQSHGGKIWVESEGIGRGAAFHFTIPLKSSIEHATIS
ncbi:MAG: hybrid sensor histidine kinase/response regulator [Elusimicrobia bacterium]|nr:hybrid sensor histidine kinase/response regulator [Elusimicrobiota bacterium]